MKVVSLRACGMLAVGMILALPTSALAIPIGWTCTGNCGTLGADGVVTAPPSGATYHWVSSSGGGSLGAADLNLGFETNGTLLRSDLFGATAGDDLQFYFNYVTSDGSGFADYAWARLLDDSLDPVALLFTARTTPGGNTAPGFGMPANSATLTPGSTPIIDGGPVWSPLGGWSGDCFSGVGNGCGYTGWIRSNFTIGATGNYVLEFGVVNWSDTIYDSGLALAGTTIAGEPIGDGDGDGEVPEPASLTLFGLAGLGAAARRRVLRRG